MQLVARSIALLAFVMPVAAGQKHDKALLDAARASDWSGVRKAYRYASHRVRAYVLRQLVAQFRTEKPQSEVRLTNVSWTLTGCGKRGFESLDKCWRMSAQRPSSRRAIVAGWVKSSSPSSLKRVLKAVWDRDVTVSERAIRGFANFRHFEDASRRKMIETLLKRYDDINDKSAGAKRGSDEYRAYVSLPVPIRETLTVLSAGEKFDSAEAWAAWFKENRDKLPTPTPEKS